jgi:hypothetical protein
MDSNIIILIGGGVLIGALLYFKSKLNSAAQTVLKSQDQALQKKQTDVVADIDKLTTEMGYKVKEQQNATVTQIEDFYDKKK